ncbi:MAG: PadR family transcriptional regulator [Acidimicrobiales bacterium]
MTSATLRVMACLGSGPDGWRHGYELLTETGLKSGSLYPMLMRLAERGLLEATWEPDPPLGRPPRHLYRLAPGGREWLRVAQSARAGRPALRLGDPLGGVA